MHALFVGHTYINVTFLTDNIPIGDEKHVGSEYAISFGGNAGLAPAHQIHRKPDHGETTHPRVGRRPFAYRSAAGSCPAVPLFHVKAVPWM
jgi:hypothetical protein